MLRLFGLLVAISIGLLLWAVRPSESRSLTQAEAVPAPAPAPSRIATEPRWIDRPVPRLPDVPPAIEAAGELELDRENQTDLVDPPDSPDVMGDPSEHDRPVDPEPLDAVETPTEAEAEPEAEPAYVPTAADEELVARAVAFLDQFLAAIESNADNCDRMADSLSELFSSNRKLIAYGKEIDGQPARSRWFANRLQDKATDWAQRIMTPLQTCMSNDRMMAVMKSFAEQTE
jgi:hypothetical protein